MIQKAEYRIERCKTLSAGYMFKDGIQKIYNASHRVQDIGDKKTSPEDRVQ